MGLTIASKDIEVTEDVEAYAAEKVAEINKLLLHEPDVGILFSAGRGGRVVTEMIAGIRGYQTLKTKAKAEDIYSSVDKATKKLKWKYKLFWTRGSFRLADC